MKFTPLPFKKSSPPKISKVERKAFLTLANYCREFETYYEEVKELLVVKNVTSSDKEKNEIAVPDLVKPLVEKFAKIRLEEIS